MPAYLDISSRIGTCGPRPDGPARRRTAFSKTTLASRTRRQTVTSLVTIPRGPSSIESARTVKFFSCSSRPSIQSRRDASDRGSGGASEGIRRTAHRRRRCDRFTALATHKQNSRRNPLSKIIRITSAHPMLLTSNPAAGPDAGICCLALLLWRQLGTMGTGTPVFGCQRAVTRIIRRSTQQSAFRYDRVPSRFQLLKTFPYRPKIFGNWRCIVWAC